MKHASSVQANGMFFTFGIYEVQGTKRPLTSVHVSRTGHLINKEKLIFKHVTAEHNTFRREQNGCFLDSREAGRFLKKVPQKSEDEMKEEITPTHRRPI